MSVLDSETDIPAVGLVGQVLFQGIEMRAFLEIMVSFADVEDFQRPGHDEITRPLIIGIVVAVYIHRLMRLVEFGEKGADFVVVHGRVYVVQFKHYLTELGESC